MLPIFTYQDKILHKIRVFIILSFNCHAIFNTTVLTLFHLSIRNFVFYILYLSIVLFILIYTGVSVTSSKYTTNLQKCKIYLRTDRDRCSVKRFLKINLCQSNNLFS